MFLVVAIGLEPLNISQCISRCWEWSWLLISKINAAFHRAVFFNLGAEARASPGKGWCIWYTPSCTEGLCTWAVLGLSKNSFHQWQASWLLFLHSLIKIFGYREQCWEGETGAWCSWQRKQGVGGYDHRRGTGQTVGPQSQTVWVFLYIYWIPGVKKVGDYCHRMPEIILSSCPNPQFRRKQNGILWSFVSVRCLEPN